MAFTEGNDINILQGTDSAVVGAGLGDDTYIISPVTLADGQEVTLSDTEGANTLQLIDGLTISSSAVASNALQLTLSNGAVINVLGADNFTFNIGGNATEIGDVGEDKDFSTFAEENLGATLPAAGEAPVEVTDEVVIGDGTGDDDDDEEEIDVDIDTVDFPTETNFDADGDAYNFIDDAAVSNYAVIENFSADDTISFVNADVNDYAFFNEGEDVTISYN
ncbi:MAG: hypothetical protein U9N77_17395, partial [Thermodesulfobacteriota bacterium]|nr:hypothetical protein [Thermodesulfobacteriota bacterium]